MEAGSRSEYRRSVGIEDDSMSKSELSAAASDLVIEAETYDETKDESEIVESIDAEIVDLPFARTPPPGPTQSGLMPLDAAVVAQAASTSSSPGGISSLDPVEKVWCPG